MSVMTGVCVGLFSRGTQSHSRVDVSEFATSNLWYGMVIVFALVALATRKRSSYGRPVKYVRNEDFEDVKFHR